MPPSALSCVAPFTPISAVERVRSVARSRWRQISSAATTAARTEASLEVTWRRRNTRGVAIDHEVVHWSSRTAAVAPYLWNWEAAAPGSGHGCIWWPSGRGGLGWRRTLARWSLPGMRSGGWPDRIPHGLDHRQRSADGRAHSLQRGTKDM